MKATSRDLHRHPNMCRDTVMKSLLLHHTACLPDDGDLLWSGAVRQTEWAVEWRKPWSEKYGGSVHAKHKGHSLGHEDPRRRLSSSRTHPSRDRTLPCRTCTGGPGPPTQKCPRLSPTFDVAVRLYTTHGPLDVPVPAVGRVRPGQPTVGPDAVGEDTRRPGEVHALGAVLSDPGPESTPRAAPPSRRGRE